MCLHSILILKYSEILLLITTVHSLTMKITFHLAALVVFISLLDVISCNEKVDKLKIGIKKRVGILQIYKKEITCEVSK